MTKVKSLEGVPGTTPTNTKTTVLNDFEKKIQKFDELNTLVKQRQILTEHFKKLNALKIPTQNQPFQEEQANNEKIVLHIAYREEYEIKNPTIMLELKEFLISKIQSRITELENKISLTEI